MLSNALLLSALAVAQPTASSIDVDDDWSLGVGVAFPSLAVGSVGPIGALGGLAGSTRYGVAVERRLSGDLWLRSDANVSYFSTSDESGPSSSSLQWAGAAGLRYVVAVLGPVSLSPYLMGSVARATADLGGVGDSRALSLGSHFGLAADYALAESLSLRITSRLLSATWSDLHSESSSSTGELIQTDGESFAIGADVLPSLELRVGF